MSDDRPLKGFACASPDSPFSDGEIRLAYGETPDGTIVYVSEAPSGLACSWACPARAGFRPSGAGCRASLAQSHVIANMPSGVRILTFTPNWGQAEGSAKASDAINPDADASAGFRSRAGPSLQPCAMTAC